MAEDDGLDFDYLPEEEVKIQPQKVTRELSRAEAVSDIAVAGSIFAMSGISFTKVLVGSIGILLFYNWMKSSSKADVNSHKIRRPRESLIHDDY